MSQGPTNPLDHTTKGFRPIIERGTWKAIRQGHRIGVQSDDFTHDVVMWITGDFEDNDQRVAYAAEIAHRLNSVNVK